MAFNNWITKLLWWWHFKFSLQEIDAFVKEFLSVVQRLPSCISTLHVLSRLPVPSTFSELQHFCSTNEAKFRKLRRSGSQSPGLLPQAKVGSLGFLDRLHCRVINLKCSVLWDFVLGWKYTHTHQRARKASVLYLLFHSIERQNTWSLIIATSFVAFNNRKWNSCVKHTTKFVQRQQSIAAMSIENYTKLWVSKAFVFFTTVTVKVFSNLKIGLTQMLRNFGCDPRPNHLIQRRCCTENVVKDW